MTGITVLPEDAYNKAINRASQTDSKPTKKHLEATMATPEDVIGTVIEIQTDGGWHQRFGEVVEVDIETATATVEELFTGAEFTETGTTTGTPTINLRLPRLGDEYTVKYLEARTDDGEWEQVSDERIDSEMTRFDRLKRDHDETRVIKKSYVHNPEDLCTVRVTPNDERNGGETFVDAEQFSNPETYERLMNMLCPPDEIGSSAEIATLYTRSDRREHDETREHEMVTMQVDMLARPNSPGLSGIDFVPDTSLGERIQARFGPKNQNA